MSRRPERSGRAARAIDHIGGRAMAEFLVSRLDSATVQTLAEELDTREKVAGFARAMRFWAASNRCSLLSALANNAGRGR